MRIVRNSGYSEKDEQRLYSELVKRVGRDTEISIEYVNELKRSKSGKLRFVISDIKEEQL